MVLPFRQSVSATREVIYWPGDRPPCGGTDLPARKRERPCRLKRSELRHTGRHWLRCPGRNDTQNARWLTHPDVDGVPLDGTEAALAAVLQELAPFRCGVGLFGSSTGAEHVLLLAQLLAENGTAVLPEALVSKRPRCGVAGLHRFRFPNGSALGRQQSACRMDVAPWTQTDPPGVDGCIAPLDGRSSIIATDPSGHPAPSCYRQGWVVCRLSAFDRSEREADRPHPCKDQRDQPPSTRLQPRSRSRRGRNTSRARRPRFLPAFPGGRPAQGRSPSGCRFP